MHIHSTIRLPNASQFKMFTANGCNTVRTHLQQGQYCSLSYLHRTVMVQTRKILFATERTASDISAMLYLHNQGACSDVAQQAASCIRPCWHAGRTRWFNSGAHFLPSSSSPNSPSAALSDASRKCENPLRLALHTMCTVRWVQACGRNVRAPTYCIEKNM